MAWSVFEFPPTGEVESRAVLRQCAVSHRFLAELKGASQTIPNQAILINTLALQEAKDSSAIENIVTTQDELYRADFSGVSSTSLAAKEVHDYATALRAGYDQLSANGLLTNRILLSVQETLEKNRAGYRVLPGTELRNENTGQVVYRPPQHPDKILRLMSQLEISINTPGVAAQDPLVRMALLHHQFESIHPFYDGNGRTGRILNVLFLVKEGLLDIPVLYLSRHFIRTKVDYYRLLQAVRDTGDWEPWILYVLQGIEQTARYTLQQVEAIRTALVSSKHRLRTTLPKIYSQDLLNNLFNHPYTKIEFVENELGVSRLTAVRYLELLAEHGFVTKQKWGRSNYYLNTALVPILTRE
jgi:Fic family protein